MPFVCDLSRCASERLARTDNTDLRGVKRVAARLRLLRHLCQVPADRTCWDWLRPKAFELRMMAIASGLASEDRLRKKAFTPYSDESESIEVLWM